MLRITPGNVVTDVDNIPGTKIIPHCVNDANLFGSGVAKAIGDKWPIVKELYHEWATHGVYWCHILDGQIDFRLGETQFIKVSPTVYVANMVGQHHVGGREIDGMWVPPVRYDCLRESMLYVAEQAREWQARIATCWFGSLRAGGSKEQTKALIEELWSNRELDVTIFEFKE